MDSSRPASATTSRSIKRRRLPLVLIAEEVAEMNPDLVGRNPKGQLESVRYEQINAMLLNEFLKEHHKGEEQDCKIQEQETTITELRSEIRSLAAMVNEPSVAIAAGERTIADWQRCCQRDYE